MHTYREMCRSPITNCNDHSLNHHFTSIFTYHMMWHFRVPFHTHMIHLNEHQSQHFSNLQFQHKGYSNMENVEQWLLPICTTLIGFHEQCLRGGLCIIEMLRGWHFTWWNFALTLLGYCLFHTTSYLLVAWSSPQVRFSLHLNCVIFKTRKGRAKRFFNEHWVNLMQIFHFLNSTHQQASKKEIHPFIV